MSTPKNVLITGASGGVGTALTAALVRAGWRVFAGVRSPRAAADAEAIGAIGIQLEITDEESVHQAAEQIAARVGDEGLGGLVNNAGIIVQGPLELVPLHALRRQFEVNVIGQVAVTQAFLPMLRQAGGTIVNMGAASGRVTVPMLGPISASKTAMESVTDALRMELKHQGVKVTIVEPGALQTEIFDKAAASEAADGYAGSREAQQVYERAIAKVAEVTASQKLVPVDNVVKTIVKALSSGSPDARYVVGRDAGLVVMLSRFPQGLRDRLLMSNLGLTAETFRDGRDVSDRDGVQL